MTSIDFQPITCTAPTPGSPYLTVHFKVPEQIAEERPLHPATSLQVSFQNGEQEAFMERMTSRDVQVVDAEGGRCLFRVPKTNIVQFSSDNGETAVKVHAWKGKKVSGLPQCLVRCM